MQESFALVVPIADSAAESFYGRLFELDPSLRKLFHGDVCEQGRELMQMLTVRGLDRLESIVPAVRALGRRHAGYGVTDEHFETVGAALLWTLEQGLGSAYTPEVADAWASVCAVLGHDDEGRHGGRVAARCGLAELTSTLDQQCGSRSAPGRRQRVRRWSRRTRQSRRRRLVGPGCQLLSAVPTGLNEG